MPMYVCVCVCVCVCLCVCIYGLIQTRTVNHYVTNPSGARRQDGRTDGLTDRDLQSNSDSD
jgi:hypothetical protein